MTRFATILKDPDTRRPVLLWEETDGRLKVVSRQASVDDLDEDVDVHAFDVATTMGKGSALNAG